MPFKKMPPLYNVWQGMWNRCRTKSNPQWKDYGGRGITVCERWRSYAVFVADMGERPAGYTLDRINNDGNYEPSNCKWSSRKEQQRNQRVTRRVTINGASYIAADLADKAGLKIDTIVKRAKTCSTLEEVISPKRRVFKEGLAVGGHYNGLRNRAKTHCKHGHPFDEKNTRIVILPNGKTGRSCKKCCAIRERRRQALLRGK